jgi:Flagellar assembly protein FliH
MSAQYTRVPHFLSQIPRPPQQARFLQSFSREQDAQRAPAFTPPPPPEPTYDDAALDASADVAPLPAPMPPPPSPSAPRHDLSDSQFDVFESAVRNLKLEGARMAEQMRSDSLEIAFVVAQRILEQEISANPKALFTLVRSAVRRVADSRKITVRLCAQDHERLTQALGAQDPDALSFAALNLVVDPSLTPGDVVVDSDLGTIDGRLSKRLEALKAAAAEGEGDAA